MPTRPVDVPEELLELLTHSRLAGRPEAERVRVALAAHLFQEGLVSIGRAAELAGEPRMTFELLLSEMGTPVLRYGPSDYDREWDAIQAANDNPA